MKDTNSTLPLSAKTIARMKVIDRLIERGQEALRLGKTKTTMAEYLRLSALLLEEESDANPRISCEWVEND
jgi:hypothetical protein